MHKQIAAIDDQINGLLYGLKGIIYIILGSEYRQSIANTIMKNFDL